MAKRKNQEAWDRLKELPIGFQVKVYSEMVDAGSTSGSRSHQWTAIKVDPYPAWVVGATWVCDGHVREAYSAPAFMDEPAEYEPAYLEVEKKIPVLLVRTSMFGKSIKVPIDGVRDVGFLELEDVFTTVRAPIVKQKQPPLDAETRAIYSRDAKEAPRDEKGRFLPVTGDNR